jgi:hypothetical protein
MSLTGYRWILFIKKIVEKSDMVLPSHRDTKVLAHEIGGLLNDSYKGISDITRSPSIEI